MGGFLQGAKAFVEPATKLIDTVARGCGIVYEPTHRKRLAKAKAVEISIIAQAIRENDDLPIFYSKDGVQIDSTDIKALAERASSRATLQEMRKQQNIEAIVDKAYVELQKETEVSSEPVDDDWIVRFFNSVEDVSNEKLQEIWARILAGEIKKPRSSSLRTLDLLKNLSIDEAALFEKVSSCIILSGEKALIPNEPDLWKEQNVKFYDLMALSDAGILGLSLVSLTVYISDVNNVLYNDYVVGAMKSISDSSPKSVVINVYPLTEAGRDLYKASKKEQPRCREFSLSYLRKMKKENENVLISAYDVLSIDEGYVRHALVNLIP